MEQITYRVRLKGGYGEVQGYECRTPHGTFYIGHQVSAILDKHLTLSKTWWTVTEPTTGMSMVTFDDLNEAEAWAKSLSADKLDSVKAGIVEAVKKYKAVADIKRRIPIVQMEDDDEH